jgi:hypothetical protein
LVRLATPHASCFMRPPELARGGSLEVARRRPLKLARGGSSYLTHGSSPSRSCMVVPPPRARVTVAPGAPLLGRPPLRAPPLLFFLASKRACPTLGNPRLSNIWGLGNPYLMGIFPCGMSSPLVASQTNSTHPGAMSSRPCLSLHPNTRIMFHHGIPC